MTRDELFHVFDRIYAGLLKQEERRKKPAFQAWTEKAAAAFNGYVKQVQDECGRAYGQVLCAWMDWTDARGLSWRGEMKRKLPDRGPLTFTPPSMAGLMAVIAAVVGALGLEDTIRRSARFSVAPTEKTRGASGGKAKSQLTVRK